MIRKELHIIDQDSSLRIALEKLTSLGENLTLFVTDKEEKVLGVITDGDIRRGLIKGVNLEEPVKIVMNSHFRYLEEKKFSFELIEMLRQNSIKIIPVLDENQKIVRLINLSVKRSILPVDAVIMAGGRGERLLPLTRTKPKPMLEIDGTPIIEHNVNLLALYGIHNIIISLHYLGEQIEQHLGNGSSRDLDISYVNETTPLGTLGALRLTDNYKYDDIIVMNSDLLTNINFEDFYKSFKESGADMAVATTGYNVTIPYAVIETSNGIVQSFKEKPTYTYFSNAGIYLIKKEYLTTVPQGVFFNATDLISELIAQNKKILSYPILGYWLDIGRHEDYLKAQEDYRHIKF